MTCPVIACTSHRLGINLHEEFAVFLLGGYGIPAEMVMRAFPRLRSAGLSEGTASQAAIGAELTQLARISDRGARYRFHAQRARTLTGAV